MKTILKIIGGLVALVIVVPLLAAVFFITTFDEKAFREQTMKQVSQALGREVVVAGPVGLDVHDGIALSLKDVSIGNPAGFAEKDFAKVGKLFVSLNWQSLLVRKVDVSQVTLADAQVSLITNGEGKNNWDFPMGGKEAKTETPQKDPNVKPKENMADEVAAAVKENRKPDFSINSVAISKIEITNADVKQLDQRANKKQEFLVKHALLKVPESGSFHADGEGLVNGAPLEMRVDTQKSLREVKEGESIPLDLHLAYNNQTYDLKGDFSFKGRAYRFDKLQASLFGSSFSGVLQADLGGSVPMITGSLNTPALDLTKFGPTTKAENGVIRATPIAASNASPLAALNSFSSDVNFSASRIVASPTLELDDVSTRVRVSNGTLTLDPLQMLYQGQTWRGAVTASASGAVHIAMQANGVDYAKLAQSFGSKSPVDSKGAIVFDLTGQGMDAQTIMSTLSGKIEIVSGPGNVDWNGGNGLGGAMVKTLLPAAATEKPKLTCAAIRFNAVNGVLQSNGLLLDSNYATVGGEGSVNLKNSTADLVLKPIPKGTTSVTSLTAATPIRVSGPLNALSYSPQADAVLQKAIGGILAPGQKINTGVPRVEAASTGNPCIAALNNPQPIMLDPPKTQDMIKDVKDQYNNIHDVIKDPSKGLGALLGGKKPDAAAPAAAPTPNAPPANNTEKAMDALKGFLGK